MWFLLSFKVVDMQMYMIKNLSLSALALSTVFSCDFDKEAIEEFQDIGVVQSAFEGRLVGEGCSESVPCRRGLTCIDDNGLGVCQATGNLQADEPCLRSDECADDLRCSWSGFCTQAGEKTEKQACGHNAECAKGLYCKNIGGLGGQCEISTGTKEIATSCEITDECADGLICSAKSKECAPGSLLLNPDTFRGVVCHEEQEALMDFQPLFEAPKDASSLPNKKWDFYALPFPNDLRISKTLNRIDLSDYPRPGAGMNEEDLFAKLIDLISTENEAFSLNPGIFMRFNRSLPTDKINRWIDEGTIRLVNLDENEIHPITGSFQSNRNKYMCGNYLYVHPLWSKPLKPDHTYALIITGSIRSSDNESPLPSEFLSTLLGDSVPTDLAEKDAWGRYKKLRDWLKTSDINADIVVGATVFTTRKQSTLLEKARDEVKALDVPQTISSSIKVCRAGVISPCANPRFMENRIDSDDGESSVITLKDPRDCPDEENPNFHEIHMKVLLPIFQKGDAPYQKNGGQFTLDNRGKPKLQRKEEVCLALTIPKDKPMPDEGWPVMLYGHGTNGSLRSGPKLLGAAMSNLMDRNNRKSATAIVAIDQVMHGSRLGDNQNLASGPLFFNVQNPVAAKGNLIQGASDHFALIRWIQTFNLPIEGVGNIKFNPQMISYHGHSQGGTTGPLFAPYADEIKGFAFSGTAGGLLFTLLGKKEPYDSTIGLRLVLQELSVDESHPALHLFQEYFDEVDPLNYGSLIFKEPIGTPAHFLQIMGLFDTYTPEKGQRAFTASTGAQLAFPNDPSSNFDRIEDLGMEITEYPIFQNYTIQAGSQVTAVTVQYAPTMNADGMPSYNGHFVTYKDRQANQQLLNFIGDLSSGLVPTIQEMP